MTIEQLKDTDGNNIVVKAGAGHKITATLKDYDEAAINKAALLTLTLTLRDGVGNIVNSRNAVNIKDVNGGYVTTAGVLSLYLTATDNTPLNASVEKEDRIVLLTYTWNDGVDAANQTGVAEYKYTVDRTTDAK